MKKLMTIFVLPIFVSATLTSCGGRNNTKVPQIKSNDSASMSLNSEKIVEKELSQKKSTLIKLKGEHKLSSISGFMGVNTMLDYYIENGKWIASGSSNSGGMREGYDIELSKEDLKKLQSMKIFVSDDLSISLICDNKEYFKSPFQEDEMNYLLKKTPKNYEAVIPLNLKSKTTFIDDYLYLYARDYVKKSEINYVDIVQVAANAVVIKFNIKTNEFEMNLFNGDLSDNSIFTFK